jgi:hypothetical protein
MRLIPKTIIQTAKTFHANASSPCRSWSRRFGFLPSIYWPMSGAQIQLKVNAPSGTRNWTNAKAAFESVAKRVVMEEAEKGAITDQAWNDAASAAKDAATQALAGAEKKIRES